MSSLENKKYLVIRNIQDKINSLFLRYKYYNRRNREITFDIITTFYLF